MKISKYFAERGLTKSFILVAAAVPLAAAGQSTSAVSYEYVNNLHTQAYIFDSQYTNGSPATASASQSFSGMDQAGNPQTMNWTGNTVSSAQYGQLHVYTDGSLANSYYNSHNDPYVNPDGSLHNANGSPADLTSLGFAFFNDTLQYGGNLQSGYQARYIFHVDGTNSGTGTLDDLGVTVDSNPTSFFVDGTQGYYARDWATADFAVNGTTPQNISVQMSTQVVFNTYDLTDGQNYTGISDYSSTATLAGIELIDSHGNLATGWTVTSASGTHYNTIQGVPEPGTLPVMLGLVGAGWLCKKRRDRNAPAKG